VNDSEVNDDDMIRRMGVIGDLHGEHERLDRVLEWMHGQCLDAVVCTGDIADGRGCINLCCDLLAAGGVATVAGNHDRWLLQDRVRHLPDAHLATELSEASEAFLSELPKQRTLDTVRGAALLCHGIADNDLAKVWPGTERSEIRRSEKLDGVLEAGEYRFLINGHMHYRVLIDFPELLLMNAGTIRGEYAGFSVIDFEAEAISVYGINEKRPDRICEHALANDDRRVWRDTQEFDGSWQAVALYR